jgi:hypothetical protein
MTIDDKAYFRAYFNQRYQERLAYALEKLGGACVQCGSTEGLQFDHVDPETKLGNVTDMLMYRLERLDAELAKCQLLCQPHHSEKTSSSHGVPHGGGKAGKRGCKCEPCRLRRREYHLAWKASH